MSDDARSAPKSGDTLGRVGVVSLGCAKNLVDTEVMLGHLDLAGYEFVRDPADADVIVVNTCSFIEPAREESVQAILEAAAYRKTGRLKRLVVAGCMVQRYRDELAESLPEVDAFVGLDEIEQIVRHVASPGAAEPGPPARPSDLPVLAQGAPAAAEGARGPRAARYLYDDRVPRRLATPPWTAYVKIAEGCDHTCAFCAIPDFRGAFRSRRPDSVVAEARQLAGAGVREINLIAQDSSHYGRDLGLREGLADLLQRLDAVRGLRWIRLHYLYPNTITETLIRTMASCERVLDYVDLPLQHAHPETLRRMRRGGSADSHLRLLDRFRAAMPDVTLRTTLIVGFPGETDVEFEALLDFVRRARFHHVGVFTYSHEEHTTAGRMTDDVPEALKQERRERLMQCQQAIVVEHNNALVGTEIEALVEGAHPDTDHLLVGRMRGQAQDVDGQILLNDGQANPGEFVRAALTETAGYDLVGRVIGAC